MFHDLTVGGRKGLALFGEKERGSINSERYDEHILLAFKFSWKQIRA